MVDATEPITIALIGSVYYAYDLPRHRWRLQSAGWGTGAVRRVKALQPDLIMLGSLAPQVATGTSPPGYEVVRLLREDHATRDLPIVMLTSVHAPEHRAKAELAGVDAYLTTPEDLAKLEATLQALVDHRRAP
jgi:CheY-like chemotaxis protein